MDEGYRRFIIGRFGCTTIADTDQGARNVLLVEAGDRIVLIDSGVGFHDGGSPGRLQHRLRQLGVDPASIDTVVLTHADFDHIGGAIDESGSPAFERADYVLSRIEAEFWATRPVRLPVSPLYDEDFRMRVNTVPPVVLEALGERLRLVHGDAAEVLEGITMIAAPGHTPGNSLVRIQSDGEELLVVGDLFYQPENITVAGWVSQYDYDAETVLRTRRSVLQDAASRGTLLMVYHMPFPGLGRVSSKGDAWAWTAS